MAFDINSNFEPYEKIYRVAHGLYEAYQNDAPPPMAIFARNAIEIRENTGISVDRSGDRNTTKATKDIAKRFKRTKPLSSIISVTFDICLNPPKEVSKIHIKQTPSKNNVYHCDLFNNEQDKELSEEQIDYLLSQMTIQLMKIIDYTNAE